MLIMFCFLPKLVFFFQAEDGIRDIGVTGVQTCALPICAASRGCRAAARVRARASARSASRAGATFDLPVYTVARSSLRGRRASALAQRGDRRRLFRSEERRVGKECRARWGSND